MLHERDRRPPVKSWGALKRFSPRALTHALHEGLLLRATWRGSERTTQRRKISSGTLEDETQQEIVIDCLKADYEVRTGRPSGL